MIPELGHFALILALVLAALLGVLPLAGAARGNRLWMGTGISLAAGLFVFMLVSYACLTYAFVTDDFSVTYVANNSNTLLPMQYKASALWGAHEGSFLLWMLIMSGWTLAVAARGKELPLPMVSRVLGIMGLLSVGFLLFLLLTSNPFARSLPMPPVEGADLNPLLQDFGLVVHPPLLYTGYVGLSVAFSFAIAALMTGRLDAAWARWSRPWTNLAWAFLTVGIALGSWWAYYELGWGGWWFWDPVENASFMPWLVATALVHSLAVTEKRGVFKSWTVLLAIAAFSLALLGAFIVRSGVLTSVHAFAVDPTRGLFILGFLVLVVGGALSLYAARAPVIRSRAAYEGLSREVLLLVNNVVLVIAMAVVLLGTLFPLGYEAVTGGDKISVGPPYFNAVFVPLMIALAIALGAAPVARWKRTSITLLVTRLWLVLVASVVLGVVTPLLIAGAFKWQVALALMLALWILGSHLRDVWYRTGGRPGRLASLGASYWGMSLAHIGFAAMLLGIAVTSHYSLETDVRLAPGESAELGVYRFTLVSVDAVRGPNYVADQGVVRIDDGDTSLLLRPEKRRYHARGNVMTEAGINAGLTADLYVALGEPLGDGAWAVRLHYKPLVRWVWLGALMMAMGGVMAMFDRRYRRLKSTNLAANTLAEGAA